MLGRGIFGSPVQLQSPGKAPKGALKACLHALVGRLWGGLRSPIHCVKAQRGLPQNFSGHHAKASLREARDAAPPPPSMPLGPMGPKAYPLDATSISTGRWYEESSDFTWTWSHEAPLEPSPSSQGGAQDEPPTLSSAIRVSTEWRPPETSFRSRAETSGLLRLFHPRGSLE